jgi:hypothetical protein
MEGRTAGEPRTHRQQCSPHPTRGSRRGREEHDLGEKGKEVGRVREREGERGREREKEQGRERARERESKRGREGVKKEVIKV